MPSGAASLRVNTINRGPLCYMQLAGIVDESFDPQALVTQANGQKLVLNLKGVSRLTSFGVREWAAAMRQLSGKVDRIYWIECSPAVVSQLNMVANFAGSAQVLSVQAPFFCEACGTDCEVRCDVVEGNDSLPRDVTCPKCGKPMSFDDDPDSYFGFPKENKTPDRVLDGATMSILRSLGVSVNTTDDIEPRADSQDPTQVPQRSVVAGLTNEILGPPTRSTSLDRVGTLSTTNATDGRSFTSTMIEVMDRHWAIVVGLAVIVVVVALYLLLTTPPGIE